MGRLERTLEKKKNKKAKRVGYCIFILIIFMLILGVNIVDYRINTFMGNYNRALILRVYDFTKGLSLLQR
ncbi:hypothetical protein SAMN05661008_01299 [Alkalithermobacter thermoalcaliphilus JW-YL-7 = DSM 7308]|uniref:Uncharacterized protein n=1 Tax=Alkalithermobacter thermoalcaliphilus JW-YL-7 = DSM 7308 TaxID=1121328 RepID=A0A150FR67_CLOPD|nr:hypothetical protein JWYL7_1169 [[Clostridium] paradoxum JW-YL-7 = DSM 7308]SHL01401.1 hypothetical protein SAMN05661008_01299 [[Clostridium] paradoxum JW-YL-7 = DSM 7308]